MWGDVGLLPPLEVGEYGSWKEDGWASEGRSGRWCVCEGSEKPLLWCPPVLWWCELGAEMSKMLCR